jgi:hypothetical protein
MSILFRWISRHKFQAYLIVFFLLSLPPVAMYFSAQSTVWIFALLAMVVLGNLLSILIP